MSWGVRVRAADGTVTFDSTVEQVLFPIDERTIAGSSVGGGLTYSYPDYTGKKVVAMLTSPYQNGEVAGWAVLSCRVTYPGGVPTVTVFVDNATSGLPRCDGYLVVSFTGAPL